MAEHGSGTESALPEDTAMSVQRTFVTTGLIENGYHRVHQEDAYRPLLAGLSLADMICERARWQSVANGHPVANRIDGEIARRFSPTFILPGD